MKKLLLLVIVTLCLFGSTQTFAQSRNRHYDRYQSERIRRAVRSGRLTPEQALRLRRNRYDANRSSYYRARNGDHRRGNGYYRRGAGSESHPVFGTHSRVRSRYHNN